MKPPNRPLLGYFFSDGRYGDYFNEVKSYTSAHYVWAKRGYESHSEESPDIWLPKMRESAAKGVLNGKKLILGLNLQDPRTPVGRVLNQLAEVWDEVAYIDLADEPDWSQVVTNQQVITLKNQLRAKGLSVPPIGVIYDANRIFNSTSYRAGELDFVTLEAYLDPPGPEAPHQARAAIRALLGRMVDRVSPAKRVGFVLQAYNRNGAWTNPVTLMALQEPVWEFAKTLGERCVYLTMFSYGRPGGTRSIPRLKTAHRRIWEDMQK